MLGSSNGSSRRQALGGMVWFGQVAWAAFRSVTFSEPLRKRATRAKLHVDGEDTGFDRIEAIISMQSQSCS